MKNVCAGVLNKLLVCVQEDAWTPLVSAVTNVRKFQWLRQRLTGGQAETSLMSKIVEFVMYENPIDIEKLRKSLHYQVSIHMSSLSVLINFIARSSV